MRVISLLPLLLAVAHAGPFTFPRQPDRRHVTLTAQDGQPLVLTIAQTITRISTTMPTPPTLPGSSGPGRTARPGEDDELELRAIFAPTGTADSAASISTASTLSQGSLSDSESESGSSSDSDPSAIPDSGRSEAQTSVQQHAAAAAQTTPAPPANDPDVASALAEQGYSQVTYYTCLTQGATYTHCGWHVPVVKVAAEGGVGGIYGRRNVGVAALGAACAIVLGNVVFGG
ncbi:hypothetical protein VPNG_09173 [Cytospora leucostoma]|uniref:Uncharacterized protein n=1 Tax=Cytospora leucostoma TaxID=1230097 RepID=A0A423VY81_9PEZI|nr:hypothetical protein VPNG_09173 [Cytospora leucostoma]